LQGYYQKQGLEQARLDPACDGYSYWTIVDVMVPQEGTYTGQGVLNAFWEEKPGGLTLDQFRRFNGPTVILAKTEPAESIAVSGDSRTVTLWISHFGVGPLRQARLSWTLKTATGALVEGALAPFDADAGDVKELGACTFVVPEIGKPVHAVFEAALDGTDAVNSWDFWFFPKRAERRGDGIAATGDLFDTLSARYPGIARLGTPEAEAALLVIGSWDHPALIDANKKGKRAIMIGPAGGEPNVKLGWWSLGDQIGTAFARHPVFGDLPHDGKLSPLWFRLIKRGQPLPIDPKLGEFQHFAVGEGQKQYFSYLFQKQGQDGERLLITRGVDLLADTPEGACLLDGMIDYARSDAFLAKSSEVPIDTATRRS